MTARTVAKKVPQTIEQADRIVVRMGKRVLMIEQLDARGRVLEEELKKIKGKKTKLQDENQKDESLVGSFADAHRNELTNGGEVKSFRFPSGGLGQWGFPSSPRLVVSGKLRTIARSFLRLPNWEKYLRIELKKNNIKADLDELRVRGLSLERNEYFRVKP